MLNIEFYKEDILALCKIHQDKIGVNKYTHKPVYCEDIICLDCELYETPPTNCMVRLCKWFATEYNPHPLTDEEKNVLFYFKEIFTKNQCKELRVFRSSSNSLYLTMNNLKDTCIPINPALFNNIGVNGTVNLIDLFKEAHLWEDEDD